MPHMTDKISLEEKNVFNDRGFLYFLIARLGAVFAMQIQAIVVAWQLYDLTHQAMALAYAGLSQFLPMVLLLMPAGDLLDRFPRKLILLFSWILQCICSAGLLFIALSAHPSVVAIYATLIVFGCSRAFSAPSLQSLLPQIVSRDRLPQAVVVNSSIMKIAVISGPLLGGVLYIYGAASAYAVCFAGTLIAIFAMSRVRVAQESPEMLSPTEIRKGSRSWQRFIAGLHYIWHRPIILGAISLDLFAVLLGDVVALLPIYANSILSVGPLGLGALRASSAVGALIVGVFLSAHPLRKHVGITMYLAVVMFGLGNLVFSLSGHFWLSLVALTIAGGADMVSVYVRSTLIQLATPDDMRGRVNAVNMLFLGSSNQLGEFRAGSVAAWIGAEKAGVVGAFTTLFVVLAWVKLFPSLVKEDSFDSIEAK
ncbi:Enterobactin exporter EntS [Halomonadaceae bacterium LMG 33818]|uniref:MFS transporter n=1 Tax=Cernens ardua TaxID=3402176 RepID=UPI003EDC63B2